MNGWTFFYIYLAGAALLALRMAWHIRCRMDKYDWKFGDVRSSFWFRVILWPLLLLNPGSLIHPQLEQSPWNKDRAAAERELDRLEQNLPPCGASIRYAPKRDEAGDCSTEFVFDAAEVLAIMEKHLAELPAEQHDRYPAILNWLRRRDPSCITPTDVPAAWHGFFLNVAVGMMNRGLGQVRCGMCGEDTPQEAISLDSGNPDKIKTTGWVFNVWRCPQRHKLLTKDAIHFFIRRAE